MTEDLYTLGPSLLGPLSKRPSPAQEIRQFIDKDTGTTYLSNGTAWVESGASLSGVISDGAGGAGIDGRLLTGSLSTAARPTGLDGLNPDPTYIPTHTIVSGDLATNSSFGNGTMYVYYETWTPTRSGTVTLLPPDTLSAVVDEVDYMVYAGSVMGVDVPTRLGDGPHGLRLADADHYYQGAPGVGQLTTQNNDSFAVTAGQVYTVAVVAYYSTNPGSAVGDIVSLHNWRFSSQQFGGQQNPVAWLHPTGANATSEGLNTTASGAQSRSSGHGSVASGEDSEASGRNNTASGTQASARGDGNLVSAFAGDGSGSGNIISGQGATGGGSLNTISGDAARGHGSGNTVSGQSAASDGSSNTVSGDAAQAMGHHNHVTGDRAVGMGHRGVAARAGSFAHGAGGLGGDTYGDAQYERLVGNVTTNDATTTPVYLDVGNGTETITIPDNQFVRIEVDVVAGKVGDPATGAAWRLCALLSAAGGATRLVGTVDSLNWHDSGAAAWVATIAVSGAELRVNVTGAAATNIRWVATFHLTIVGV